MYFVLYNTKVVDLMEAKSSLTPRRTRLKKDKVHFASNWKAPVQGKRAVK
jgi:hypothetical protein